MPASVSSGSFGKLWSYSISGQVSALAVVGEERRTDGRMGHTYIQTDRQRDGRTDRRTYRQAAGRTDRWTILNVAFTGCVAGQMK
jgi:hypothetical protein